MARIDALLQKLLEQRASDLHLGVGSPIRMRIDGDLLPMGQKALAAEQLERIMREIVSEQQWADFDERNDCDFAYAVPGVVRVRASYLRTQNGLAAVFRTIPETILSAEQLGLAPAIVSLADAPSGLVLVTGPTGSGKSTTLAAMIDWINVNRSRHIITIEDPIEFVHPDKRSAMVQREVGSHSPDFARALRAAVREDPDVILVGELRDEETMTLALDAAEMGFLVFGTLHTNSAAKTIDRVVDLFPTPRQPAARLALASTLRGVVAQLLLKRVGGGRVAAHEVLVANPAIANLVRTGDTTKIASVLQTGGRIGMCTMDQTLMRLCSGGYVAVDEALAKAADKVGFRRWLQGRPPDAPDEEPELV